jgi:hypothetical protein
MLLVAGTGAAHRWRRAGEGALRLDARVGVVLRTPSVGTLRGGVVVLRRAANGGVAALMLLVARSRGRADAAELLHLVSSDVEAVASTASERGRGHVGLVAKLRRATTARRGVLRRVRGDEVLRRLIGTDRAVKAGVVSTESRNALELVGRSGVVLS